MGTGRHNNYKGQKGPAALHKKGKEHTANSAGRPSKSVLRDKLPKAGMIYPFHNHFTKRLRADIKVDMAIKKGLDEPLVTKRLIEGIFSRTFEAATKLLGQAQDDKFRDDPIALMGLVRASDGIQAVWMRVSVDMLVRVFLVLRAARHNWHQNPRLPHDIAQHGKTARAIDAFLAVDNLNWGGHKVIEWLLRSGVDLVKSGAGRDAMEVEGGMAGAEDDVMEVEQDDDSDDDSDDGIFVKQDYTSLAYSNLEEGVLPGKSANPFANPAAAPVANPFAAPVANSAAAPVANPAAAPAPAPQVSAEEVVEGMRRLNIEVDQADLAEAFGKLRIKPRLCNPFHQSDDEGDEDDEPESDDKFRSFH